jgi:hypothetical protein
MECFAHAGVNAVGVCRHCGKAVCRGCAIDRVGGLTCSEACAAAVGEAGEITERTKLNYGIGGRRRLVSTQLVHLSLTSLLFAAIGFYLWFGLHLPIHIPLLCWAIAAISAASAYVAFRRFRAFGT